MGGFQLKVFCFALFCRVARNPIARFECSISKFQGFMYIVWSLPSVQVLPHSQPIFPSKQKSLKNQCLSHSESKSYQINSWNPAHQDVSSNTKGTFQFLRNFQLQFNKIFSEKIIQELQQTSVEMAKVLWYFNLATNLFHRKFALRSSLSKSSKRNQNPSRY